MEVNQSSTPLDQILLNKTRSLFKIGFQYAPLLYLSFGVVDYLYAGPLWIYFFSLRLLHFVLAHLIRLYLKSPDRTLEDYKWMGVLWAFVGSAFINIMIFAMGGASSPYYAGLNLVALLAIFFIPYDFKILILCAFSIYLPYFLFSFIAYDNTHSLNLLMNSGFIFATVSIALSVRSASHKSLLQEIDAQNKLSEELENREKIISERTRENLRLQELSSQFSPQVVRAIQNQQINLDNEVQNRRISVIFVDIVNSTSKITSLPIDQTQKAISLFIQDCVHTFLKYDLTLDKFLGDGFLAFCNAPVTYHNYADRVLLAAHELRERLQNRVSEYEKLWQGPFEIRIGVASGDALIGFYGDKLGFRSYTGLGPVVNKASRLCSQVAKPNQIVVSEETLLLISQKQFDFEFLGSHSLKGFIQQNTRCFSLKGFINPKQSSKPNLPNQVCPLCSSHQLFLSQNSQGQYVYQCRSCSHILDQTNPFITS